MPLVILFTTAPSAVFFVCETTEMIVMKFGIGHLYQNPFDGFEFAPCQFNITARDVRSVGLLCCYIDLLCSLLLGNGKDIVTSKGL
jgi:hypothetical protein